MGKLGGLKKGKESLTLETGGSLSLAENQEFYMTKIHCECYPHRDYFLFYKDIASKNIKVSKAKAIAQW